MGSTGASASNNTRQVFTQPRAAEQSRGVHKEQFLQQTTETETSIHIIHDAPPKTQI